MKKLVAVLENCSVTSVDINGILAAIQSARKASKQEIEEMSLLAYHKERTYPVEYDFFEEEEEEEEVVWNDPTDM